MFAVLQKYRFAWYWIHQIIDKYSELLTANRMFILGEHLENYGKTVFKMVYKEFVPHIYI